MDLKDAAGATDDLVTIIKSDVIPRLLDAQSDSESSVPALPLNSDVQALAAFLRRNEPTAANDLIVDLVKKGMSAERVIIDLFAPTANLIGEMWADDDCTFTDVTVVLARLHLLTRELGIALRPLSVPNAAGYLAVLSPAPGEQHIFGLTIVEQFLVANGVDVLWTSPTAIVELVQTRFVHVVGFTMSQPERVEALAELVGEISSESKNPDLATLVGGRCFVEDLELAERVDATIVVSNERHTLTSIRDILDQLAPMGATLT